MKQIFLILLIYILLITACTTGESPPTQSPPFTVPASTPKPSRTPTTLPAKPSITNTPIYTPRPTIDLALVLTPQATVDYEVKYIPLKTSDGVQLLAKHYGDGDLVVILAHQGTQGANQRDWEPFARLIAARGYSAATLDFRGRGFSKGDITATYYLIRDMRALIDHLLGEGYRRFVCIGASMGGSTCLRAAVEYDLEGVVVIGSFMGTGEPTKVSMEELAAMKIPKLFITTEKDRNSEIPAAIKDMYELSQEPKLLRVFPGEAHGTEMFKQPYGEQFTAELLAFLEGLR